MKLIIDIPKTIYTNIKSSFSIKLSDVNTDKVIKAIKNGTPLPKEHGKIIDIDQFYNAFNEYLSERKSFSFADLETILNVVTPPILKADKEIENESNN